MTAKSMVEVEVKIRVQDPEAVKALLAARGFDVIHPRTFERNLLFDTGDRAFRLRREVVRLRDFGGVSTLAFKGAATEAVHKSREELEVRVSDGAAAALILERIGLHPVFIYEKYRAEFQRPGEPGTIMLDETVVGAFLELEGPDPWIDTTARELGYAEADYLTASYGRLYLEWCAARGLQPGNMLWEG